MALRKGLWTLSLVTPFVAAVAGGACSKSSSASAAAGTDDAGAEASTPDASTGAPPDSGTSPPPNDGGSASTPDAPSADGTVADAGPNPDIEAMHVRADEALYALMLNDWASIAANTTTYDWMYAHYWDAVLDATERRGPTAFTGTPKMFFELQQQRGWLDGFYDDENWITLALLHAYKVTGDMTYLTQAETVFADIMNAWDTTCCGANKGGMWWEKPNIDKVTAINAGAVISASRLYAATKDGTYLAFGQKVYAFWSTYMVDSTTGHVYDNENDEGGINTTWSFTYNEGLFIGAVVELARVTGDTSNFPLAHTVASYMMSKEIETLDAGTILSDGNCSGDGDMFKGIAARYLGELYAADPSHTEYRDFLRRSADAAWTRARDVASGNISCDWQGPYDPTTGVVGALGSAAMAIAAAAEALGPGAQRPPLIYEAEEGDLHSVGLEAKYAGFSGWGYVAGWGSGGESVDILVNVPTMGAYALGWRYATGDNAVRALSVNGVQVNGNLAFPSTGGYTSYGLANAVVTLNQGANVLTLSYSSGFVNLDNVQLVAQ